MSGPSAYSDVRDWCVLHEGFDGRTSTWLDVLACCVSDLLTLINALHGRWSPIGLHLGSTGAFIGILRAIYPLYSIIHIRDAYLLGTITV